jgi:hypothetical protein
MKKIFTIFLMLSIFTTSAQTINTTGNQSVFGHKRFNTGLYFGVDSGLALPFGFDKNYIRFAVIYDYSSNSQILPNSYSTGYGFNDQGMATHVASNTPAGEPRLGLSKLRGTLYNPQSVQNGDMIGRILFTPYNVNDYNISTSISSVMTGTTDNLFTNSNLVLNVRKNGNNSLYGLDPFIELNPNGNIYLPQTPPNISGTPLFDMFPMLLS